MSTASAGAFILQSNSGEQDDLITGARDLHDRLASLNPNERTLDIIRETHLFPMEKSYSASVPIGMEYFKGVKNGTTQSLGSTVTFELSQYGAFISDCVVHVQLSALGTAPTITNDLIVDAATKSEAKLYNDIKYRWTDYPGIRLFKTVTFKNAGSELHHYTRDTVLKHHNHFVKPSQRTAWERAMGHGADVNGTSYHRYEEVVENKKLNIGPQCPKFYQPPLDLWIPLKLFFCDGQPFPSSKVIHGQRSITVSLEESSFMAQAIDVTGVGSNDTLNVANLAGGTGGVQGNLLPGSTLYNTSGVTQPEVEVLKMDLYMNNLFVTNAVLDAYMNTLTYTMIRVDKVQTVRDNLSSKSVRMTGFKYPIENIAFGFRETRNATDFEKWWRFNRAVSTTFRLISSERDKVNTNPDNVIALNYQYFEEDPVVDSISITVQGQRMFDNINPGFFSRFSSLPRCNGSEKITTARDPHAYLVHFSQNTGEYQPSGHFNSSKNREFEFSWNSSIATLTNTIEFVACAKCIAFILVENGTSQIVFTV
jgi:hypothetical protein